MKIITRTFLAACFLPIMAQAQSISHALTPQEKAALETYSRDFNITDPPAGPVRMIAEFEPMMGVMVTYQNGFGIPTSAIAEMTQGFHVVVNIAYASQQNTINPMLSTAGCNMDNVSYQIVATDTYWSRDYGPWFIVDGNNKIGVVDFPYNRPRPNDDDIPVIWANSNNLDLYGMNVIQTGGNYMCDGYGIAAQTELVWEENPSQTHQEIADKMKDYLGIENLMVIDDPLGDYIKHIDCWGKFLAVDKVLVGKVPESDPRYDDYEAAAAAFAETNCSYGYPFKVYRTLGPGGYSYTTPYSNSLILNNKVFIPIGGNQYDQDALDVYAEAMPGYEIHSYLEGPNGWLNTDALHCRTHELADTNMLSIRHLPLYGEQELAESYEIRADIMAFSNQPLYADSVKVFYQINGGDYNFIPMTLEAGNTYVATLTDLPPAAEVAYYIHAADESGKSENVPYIGRPDAFTFTVEDNVSVGQFPAAPASGIQSVYPNPVTNYAIANLRLAQAGNAQLALYDLTGRKVYSEDLGTLPAGHSDVVVHAESLQNGTYLMAIETAEGIFKSKINVIR